jgi:hypothetical protein
LGMAEKLIMTYPCGFSFVAPHGEDDAVAVAQLHTERIQEGLHERNLTSRGIVAYERSEVSISARLLAGFCDR